MERNLSICRSMKRELKTTTKMYQNKDHVNARHSAAVANIKQNPFYLTLSHKNNHVPNIKKCAYLPDAVSLSNEEFIQANSQLWLNEGCLQLNVDYNDIYDQWESIIQINFYTAQEVICPICLDSPKVCRTDKCGHIYCYPCLNKFLSYNDGFYKKCALCNQHIDRSRLKRASFISRFSPHVGDTISMLLMKRTKNGFFPVPITVDDQHYPPSAYSDCSRFSSVVVCSNDDLRSLIRLDIMVLEDCLADAIREDSDRTNAIMEALQATKNEMDIRNGESSKPIHQSNVIPLETIDQLKDIMIRNSVYYQSEDGCNIFMCPLNWKCMIREYVDNSQCLPLRVSGRILEIERFTVTPEFINRYRYLKYLPLGSAVCFVDIDLTHVISEDTLKVFDREIQWKKENRSYQEQLDRDLTKEKIKQENSFNSSTGFICLNSLMKETNNILDDDFVPLCAATPTSPMNNNKSFDDKRLSFADMIHAKTVPSVPQSLSWSHKEPEVSPRGFSLTDCVVKKTKNKKSKK